MLTDNLLAFWRFNDSVASSIGSGLDLASGDAAGHYIDAKVGRGWTVNDLESNTLLLLDGGSIGAPLDAAGLSISLWFRWTAGAVASTRQMFGNAANTILGIFQTTPDATTIMAVVNISGDDDQVVWTDASLQSGWHHVVAVVDNDGGIARLTLYVDGQQRAQHTFTDEGNQWVMADLSGLPIGVGCSDIRASIYRGDIDALGIWSRALTAGDVADLYNAGDGWEYDVVTQYQRFIRGPGGIYVAAGPAEIISGWPL